MASPARSSAAKRLSALVAVGPAAARRVPVQAARNGGLCFFQPAAGIGLAPAFVLVGAPALLGLQAPRCGQRGAALTSGWCDRGQIEKAKLVAHGGAGAAWSRRPLSCYASTSAASGSSTTAGAGVM